MIFVVSALFVAISVFVFSAMEPWIAVLFVILGGWAFLPNVNYPQEEILLGRETLSGVHSLAVTSPSFFNKASLISLSCLIGVILFDWPRLRQSHLPRPCDWPILIWCATPICSVLNNGGTWGEGLFQTRHLILAWGVPYLMGRLYFGESLALRDLDRAWVVAGLLYFPLCFFEFFTGSLWYPLVYGSHPYRFSGDVRFIGHRPLVFLEHGNQLGMWTGTAAAAAIWLWVIGDRQASLISAMRNKSHLVPIFLLVSFLAYQSHGAIVLLLLCLAPLVLRGRIRGISRSILIAVFASLGIAILLVFTWVLFRSGGDPRTAFRNVFVFLGKKSFTWRLARLEENIMQATLHPILGWGQANWSSVGQQGHFTDPVAISLWILGLGMYGLVGFLALTATLFTPVVATILKLWMRVWDRPTLGYVTTALVLFTMNILDLAMNSCFLLPMMLIAGGLNSWSFSKNSLSDLTSSQGAKSYRIPV